MTPSISTSMSIRICSMVSLMFERDGMEVFEFRLETRSLKAGDSVMVNGTYCSVRKTAHFSWHVCSCFSFQLQENVRCPSLFSTICTQVLQEVAVETESSLQARNALSRRTHGRPHLQNFRDLTFVLVSQK